MNPKLKSTVTTASFFILLLIAIFFSTKSSFFQVVSGIIFFTMLIFEIVKKQTKKRMLSHSLGSTKKISILDSLVNDKYGENVELKFLTINERKQEIQIIEKSTGTIVFNQILFGSHPNFEAISEEAIKSINKIDFPVQPGFISNPNQN